MVVNLRVKKSDALQAVILNLSKGALTVAALLLFLTLFASFSLAQSPDVLRLTGKVIQVSDGDTLTLRGEKNHKIRLASIDAPEKASGSKRPGQPHSEASRDFLANRVAGRTLTLLCYEVDRYDRYICDIPDGHGTVNQALVAAGLAWANQQAGGRYLRDRTLPELEAKARAARLGLWAEPGPVPPWVWRRDCWNRQKCGS